MIGIDEVGRGAWAGPLVLAGCYFIENPGFIEGLNDSKLLSATKRNKLAPQIMSSTIFKIVCIEPETIDQIGLTASIKQGILEILEFMPQGEVIQLDGKFNFLKGTSYEDRAKVEVRADSKYPSVMAASVLAKVERDALMRKYHTLYPQYGFSTNVGYGTIQHRSAIVSYGITPIHRMSFAPIKERS